LAYERSATLNDGENTLRAKFSPGLKDKLSSGIVKDNSFLKLTDVKYDVDANDRKAFAVINGFEVVKADVAEMYATTPGKTSVKIEPKTPGSSEKKSVPLAALNPYRQPWCVKVKLTSKSPVREFKGVKGTITCGSVEFVDEEGTAIGATLWREALDKFHAMLEPGKVYYVSKGSLKPANKQYSTSGNDYEMHLDGKAEIELCPDVDQSSAQKMQRAYAFCGIDRLASKIGSRANPDIVAVVKEVGELSTIRRKSDNSELTKREITIVDESAKTVVLTLWNTLATDQGAKLAAMTNPVIIVRSVRVGEYAGVSLSTVTRSELEIEPENVERVAELKKWYAEGGSTVSTEAAGAGLATAATAGKKNDVAASNLAELQPDAIPPSTDKPTFAWVCAHTMICKADQPMYYCSAPDEGNSKKVIETNGKWYCEANGKTYDTCKRRYITRFKMMDASGSAWVNCFNDEAEKMFGVSADELNEMKENDFAKYERTVKRMEAQHWSFLIKCSSEEYQGETKRRMTAVKCNKIDYAAESKKLLSRMGVSA